MRHEAEFNGYRGETRSWLRVYATADEEPALYAWVLKHPDETVRGRQWITEIGFKRHEDSIELSCVVKTDEHSTLAARSPVMASCPRVIGYIVHNIEQAQKASFAPSVGAVEVKSVGEDHDSYRTLNTEIERRDRNCALVIVSPTRDGGYLLNVTDLQQKLIGLGQVVEVSLDFNSYDMADAIGQQRSAWSGAVNVVYTPLATGLVRNGLFLSEEILEWGSTQRERASHLLAWVTNNTNIPRMHEHVRPEGVMQLALRRRMQAARAKSEHMNAAQLRIELDGAAKQAAEQAKFFDELADENSQLETRISEFKEDLEEARGELGKKEFTIQSLKDQLARRGGCRAEDVNAVALVDMALRDDPPLPLECLDPLKAPTGNTAPCCRVQEAAPSRWTASSTAANFSAC